MDTNRSLRDFADALDHELRENILRYWCEKMIDRENGGFYGRRDGYDNLVEGADKGVILNTRILWTFSAVSRNIDGSYLSFASRAYDYLVRYFLDHDKGGVYWMVDHLGHPVDQKKQIYGQAFAVYALSEFYAASRSEEALQHSIEIYRLIEKHSFDSLENGYLEAFDRNWNLLSDLRLSDKDANEKKTMNTHLHVLEAYTSLYKVWPDKGLKRQLKNLLFIFRDRILNNNFHFDLFFDEHWNRRSNTVSYGHDIEGSWLLQEAAEAVGEEELTIEISRIGVKMVDVVLAQGVDKDGAIRNEGHDPDRHWWPQAEALVGFVNSWQVTGQSSYLASAFRVWDFISSTMIDRKNGEWFWRVNEAGEVNYSEDKAGPWKCPYHNGRAIIELLNRLRYKFD
jgi:cellobiose epimerase